MKGHRCLSFCLNKYSLEVSNLYTQKAQEYFLCCLGPKSNITQLWIDSSINVLPTCNFLPLLLSRMPLLESLVIDNRRKKIDPALLSEALAALLKAHRALPCGSGIKTIRLRSVKILKESAGTISELLPELPELEKFEIVGCDYESDDCYGIVAASIIRSKVLRHLTWTRVPTKDAKALNAIAEAIKLSPALESLEFEYVRGLEKAFMKKLAAVIMSSPTIKSLKLCLNTIPPECVKEFSDCLAANKVIKSLVLNIRNLSDECNKDILTALRGNSKLKKLHLVSEGMCTESTIVELVAMLQTNRSIEKLKFVLLGDYPSIDRLKGVLTENDKIRVINIKVGLHPTVQFEAINLLPVFEGLAKNGKIEKATFPVIPSNPDTITRLKEFIEQSNNLHKLKLLKAAGLSADAEKSIGEAINKNEKITFLSYKTDNIAGTLQNLALEKSGHLRKLKIDGHRSKTFPTPQQFTQLINSNTNLQSLKLLQCNINNKAAIEIAKAIEKHPVLQKVNLRWILADASGILRLAEAMKKNRKLKALDVQNSAASAQLANFMDVWERDKQIFAGNNKILSFEWMVVLLSYLSEDQKLRKKVGKKVKAFLDTYKHCVNGTRNAVFPSETQMQLIKKIIFSNSGLGPTMGKKIAKIISTCPGVEHISFMGNKLKTKGAVGVSRMIPKLPKLTVLDLSFNRIGYKGILYVAEVMKTNTTITHLNIKGNYIHTHGGTELVMALAKNPNSKVEVLDIGSCKIECHIIETFKHLPMIGNKLKTLGMIMNPINVGFVKSLICLYQEHKWGMRINVSLRNHEGIAKRVAEAGLRNLIKFINQLSNDIFDTRVIVKDQFFQQAEPQNYSTCTRLLLYI
eukprot:TRINITY_DN2291_c0_g1_i1.p2 TRINITY_DN2291_c0_g1~~TRINITY_DN2291_c0_g1_i1.p2  ORF type:complete len:858 (-),score=76.75 TRINITY_DN2291_c0_g1_i1:5642-8215(-)